MDYLSRTSLMVLSVIGVAIGQQSRRNFRIMNVPLPSFVLVGRLFLIHFILGGERDELNYNVSFDILYIE